ncbi:hypothetical protein ACFLVG_05340 [Chloroflexota bacterium]
MVSVDSRQSGILRGIDDSGCLIIATKDGEKRIVMSGDISIKAV